MSDCEFKECQPLKESYVEVKIPENEAAGVILSAWEKALNTCIQKMPGIEITGIGVAVPSPFDFCERYCDGGA